MGGLSKKPNKPKPEPVMPAPDLLSLDKASKRRRAAYGSGTILSESLG